MRNAHFFTGLRVAVLLLLMVCFNNANGQIINTIAGDSTSGYTGDGSLATAAELGQPFGVAVDSAGNVYIADNYYNVIRKVNTSGIISTFAGIGFPGNSGDGGPATAAELSSPNSLLADRRGNIYIADAANHKIRKVSSSGIISTFAGNGSVRYFSGDSSLPAIDAAIGSPVDLAIDRVGNIYFTDGNSRVGKIDTAGMILLFAGSGSTGTGGDGGPATAAVLSSPTGIAIDSAANVYISENTNNTIRVVNAAGIINTFAGSIFPGYSGDGGPATAAKLDGPEGLAVDPVGNLYIADANNSVIRMIDRRGIIRRVAGDYGVGFLGDGGPATLAKLDGPGGIIVDVSGDIYIADNDNHRVRKVGGCIVPYAGVITGVDTLCAGDVITLTSSVIGGLWVTTDSAVATVTTSGVVSGITDGAVTLRYIVTNSCSSDTTLFSISEGACNTGILQVAIDPDNLLVYPNPGNGLFSIRYNSGVVETCQLTVFNLLGEKVKELPIKSNSETEINLQLARGVYFLKVLTGNGKICKQITVQ